MPAPRNATFRDIGAHLDPLELAFYLARPRATNDLHGLGAFPIMNEQLRRRWF